MLMSLFGKFKYFIFELECFLNDWSLNNTISQVVTTAERMEQVDLEKICLPMSLLLSHTNKTQIL